MIIIISYLLLFCQLLMLLVVDIIIFCFYCAVLLRIGSKVCSNSLQVGELIQTRYSIDDSNTALPFWLEEGVALRSLTLIDVESDLSNFFCLAVLVLLLSDLCAWSRAVPCVVRWARLNYMILELLVCSSTSICEL